jgi:ACS family tartrate transporter-like MFS transporter
MNDLDRTVTRKVAWRLMPLLMACYFVAFLDRVNVGFAALTMNKDLGLTPVIFGWGAGIFFLGYFLFEVPSNLLLERVGARLWIARIMFSWGVVSAATALVEGPATFLAARFLLGLAEAGFFPGIVLYLTYWFPAAHRAKMVGMFMAAVPISGVIGSPISGWILAIDGWGGLHGWQWLFILEGIPSIAMSFVVLACLQDRPARAPWLGDLERDWLEGVLQRERDFREGLRTYRLGEALLDGKVLLLCLVYLGLVTGLYGVTFWLPQIIKAFGLSNIQVGYVNAVPTFAAAIAMILWTRHSDRRRERTWHVALPSFLGFLGLAASAYLASPVLAMVALTAAAVGIYAAIPTSWTLPTAFLTGTAAAGGIALINSVGNLGGFAGPYLMGWLKERTGDYGLGLLVLAIGLALAGLIALALRRIAASERPAA